MRERPPSDATRAGDAAAPGRRAARELPDAAGIREHFLDLCIAANRAHTLAAIYEPALDAVCGLLGVERAAILLYDDDDVLRFKAWRGLSDSYRAAVEGHSPWPRDAVRPAPVFIADLAGDASLAAYGDLFVREGLGAIGFVPLVASETGRLLGKFMVYANAPRRFSEQDTELAIAVALHVAQAVSRAQLLAAERQERARARRAEERMAFLFEAGVILSGTLAVDDTLDRLARLIVPRMADWCGIETTHRSPDGAPVFALIHADPAKAEVVERVRQLHRQDPSPSPGAAEVLRDRRPILRQRLAEGGVLARGARHELLSAMGGRSAMVVPMIARERVLGTIHFVSTGPEREYTVEDLEVAALLGRTAGVAVDNAVLYEHAQRATRDREDILEVVSHDLRNPLGAVLMSADYLGELGTDGAADGKSLRKSADLIRRSATRMARLIEDLNDFARIQGGHFKIEPRVAQVHTIVDAVVDSLSTLAQARQVELVARVAPELRSLVCDQHRVIQALGNYAANAVKVTGASGRVTVGAEPAERHVTFFVEDTGPGIAAADLPRLFDRYWRARNPSYSGTGLGLSIVKGIAEAHGGLVGATSQLGVGSRFEITLPR